MPDLTIDISKSPKLKEYFSRKEIGHKCKFEIEFQLGEKDENQIKGDLNKVLYHEEGEEKEVKPTEEEPVLVEMKPASKGKAVLEAAY